MALRNNRTYANISNTKSFGGANSTNISFQSQLRGIYSGSGEIGDSSGVPNGYNMGAPILPLKDGGMSSYVAPQSSIIPLTRTLAAGKALAVTGTLVITQGTITLDQIVPLTAAGNLSIVKDSASLSAAVNLTANSTMQITASSSTLGGIFEVTASSNCAILSDSELTALAFIEAVAGGPEALSPAGLAAAVWNASLSSFNEVGSTGEALGNASSAGNPWDTLVADSSDPGTFGEHVGKKLITKTAFLGLK